MVKNFSISAVGEVQPSPKTISPSSGSPDYPCRVNAVPRPIPEKKWFMEPWVIVALGGVLPFGSIFIEMYFIFTSFWAYKIYYVYGFMLLGERIIHSSVLTFDFT